MNEFLDGDRAVAESEPASLPSYDVVHVEAELVSALKRAAVSLRDAELGLQHARERYQTALQAFNRHVAPVPK